MRKYDLTVLGDVLPPATEQLRQIVEAIRFRVECPVTVELGGQDWNAIIEIQPQGQKPVGVVKLLSGRND